MLLERQGARARGVCVWQAYLVHAVAPAAEKVPAGHGPVAAAAPAAPQ